MTARSAALLLGCSSACVPPPEDAARRAWLVERLTEDNAPWLVRGLDVAGKYAVMADDPYDFLRGTAAVFLADLARPDPSRARTAFLTAPEATAVRVVGDPHPENLGTCLPGPEPDTADADPLAPLTLEWVDLDAAAFGPWTVDTRRAALALALGFDGLDGCDGPCGDLAVETFARAYAAELLEPGWDPAADDPTDGALVAELRARARWDGVTRRLLSEATTTEGGRRTLVRSPVDDNGDAVRSPSAEEQAALDRLLAAWDARPAGFRVLDAARVFGRGVASRPAPRFLIAWDRGDDGPQDDRLLNLREVIDPPRQPVPVGLQPTLGPGEDRIGEAAVLWSRPDADVAYDGVADGGQVFKVTSESGWFQLLDHHALASAYPADVVGLARVVGRALAAAHARAPGPDGQPGRPVIAADLRAGGGVEVLVEERLRDARADLARLRDDHWLFLQALDLHGPLLGAGRVVPR